MRATVGFLAAAAVCVAAAGSLVSLDAGAVGTRIFRLDSLDELSGGDLRGVAVGSDGVVRAGWTLGSVPMPAGAGSTATCAVALADGSVLVGTGPSGGGKIVRVANDQASVYADTGETAVSALAVDRAGTVYAATTGSKVYRIVGGKAQPYATVAGAESVLALAVDRGGSALYAGTGSDGAVFRIEAGGAASVYFKTDEPFVVSLAVADDGAVYAGTGGKGLLYRITGPGRATVLYDFHGEDVHAIATAPGGRVYAIANEGADKPATESSESTSSHHASGRSAPGPSPVSKPKVGKGALWRFDAQGRPERMMHHDDFHYVSLAVDDHGTPYVGTGAEGRVYTVDDAHAVSLVADTDERQVTAIGLSGRTRFVLGSDPATFHRILATGGPDSVWTSKALDAGLRARFGHLTWRGAGGLEVSTRSGDTQTPDSTWSPWSAAVAEGGAVTSPAGRFVQVRARLEDGAASLSGVALAFRTENLRAVVTEITAHDRAAGAAETKEGLTASGGGPGRHDSVVRLSWKVENPDEDELRYRVQFRREGERRWIDATRPDDVVTKAELEWDTSALPEGKYRVRVQATDETVNPLGDVTEHALESAPVRVDNTPPVFKSLSTQGRRLRAEVVDGLGPITRVEVAIDGRAPWRPLAAA
ncbi:MAG: hypothetical protein ACRENE_00935, partial [Polyangiaceae bacterium]